MKVSLVHMPQWSLNQPPIGLAYLTGSLRKKGIQVEQIDLNIKLHSALDTNFKEIFLPEFHLKWIHNYDSEIQPIISSYIQKWAKTLAHNNSEIIGFSVLTSNINPTVDLASKIKKINPNIKIVFGGPFVAEYEEGVKLIKQDYVDVIVFGEGETTLLELVEVISNKKPLNYVNGIIWKEEGKIIKNQERPLIKDLDSLPFPDYSDYNLNDYQNPTIPILGSRGCINNCTFCSEKRFWKYYRFRTGQNIFSEMREQINSLNINSFYMVDSLINGNIKELHNLCNLIIKNNLGITWGGKATIRNEMNFELLNKLKKAGCNCISYGIESGSDKVLKNMNKNNSAELNSQVLRDTKKAGILVSTFWIVGYPTETNLDFNETLNFIRKNSQNIDIITPGYGCGIQKGSILYDQFTNFGITFEEDGWYSKESNPQIRKDRINALIKWCKQLNLRID